MGYTHYWNINKELPREQWDAFKTEVIALVDHDYAEGIVWSKEDDIFPRITDEVVSFNGIGDGGHETFVFSRNHDLREHESPVFNFCKTARKPYDKYVVKVLMLAEKHFGDSISVKSDGGWEDVKSELTVRPTKGPASGDWMGRTLLWKQRYDELTNRYFNLSEYTNEQTIEIGHLRKRIKDLEDAVEASVPSNRF